MRNLDKVEHKMYIHDMTRDEILKDVADRCLAVRVLRAGRVLSRLYDEAVRPLGITGTQFTLINVIEQMKPDSIASIGERLDIDATTLSRNLKRLETAGIIEMGEQGPDRKRSIGLTEHGRTLLDEAYEAWKGAQAKVEALYEADEIVSLKENLLRIRGL